MRTSVHLASEDASRTIAFYISGHGFGHASRVIEVINTLTSSSSVRVIVRTSASRWLFERTVKDAGRKLGQVTYHDVDTDTGVVQIDSLHLDVGETVRRTRAFMRTFDERIEAEATFLRSAQASLVVADIPPLGIAAAAAAGIPSVALGNFTWDWIYSAYPGAGDIVQTMEDAYARANVALRLPMHGGFASFPRSVDIPFIARRSVRDADETRAAMGLPLDERLVLVSFGGYGLERLDLDALTRLQGYVALVSERPPARPARRGNLMSVDETAMYAAGLRYEDLVRAVDVVVTKPGYGIIAECIANDAALLYTSRGHFIEYDVLVAEMPHVLRAAYIDHADLFAGHWTHHLDGLLARPAPPERPRVDGAEVAVEQLLAMVRDGGS